MDERDYAEEQGSTFRDEPTKKEAAIEEAVKVLEERSLRLQKMSAIIGQRFETVLRPGEPEDDSNVKAVEPMRSPLASRLFEVADRMYAIERSLQSMERRTDL